MTAEVVLVAAVDEELGIGRDGGIPWHLPDDLRRFRDLTTPGTLLMGRGTFDSIGRRALPGRDTIVVSRGAGDETAVRWASSFEAALAMAAEAALPVYVVGGASAYRWGVEVADRIELTQVVGRYRCDTFFPRIDLGVWRESARVGHDGFDYVTYRRRAHG